MKASIPGFLFPQKSRKKDWNLFLKNWNMSFLLKVLNLNFMKVL
jgi:hypothetical protein